MNDQQDLTNRIFALASSISLSLRNFVDVKYLGTANQLQIGVIGRNNKTSFTAIIDLHEHGESDLARERINRRLLEVVTHLESLQAKPLQRSLLR